MKYSPQGFDFLGNGDVPTTFVYFETKREVTSGIAFLRLDFLPASSTQAKRYHAFFVFGDSSFHLPEKDSGRFFGEEVGFVYADGGDSEPLELGKEVFLDEEVTSKAVESEKHYLVHPILSYVLKHSRQGGSILKCSRDPLLAEDRKEFEAVFLGVLADGGLLNGESIAVLGLGVG